MEERKRIELNDIVIGVSLLWDVYDENNQLLLRRGFVVRHSRQAETLIERGLYINKKRDVSKRLSEKITHREKPSVVRLINLANKRLEWLLRNVHAEEGAQAKFLEIAKTLAYATSLNPDVALACILLNQSASRYTVRHSVDTALVSLVIARALKKEEGEMLSLAAAALTMNIGMLRQHGQLHNKQHALSDEDKQIIRNHPLESVKILEQAGVDDGNWLSYVLAHHENEDGSGYPHGKDGQEITANVKILSIADRYCARVSLRDYRKSLLPNAALRDILFADKKTINPILATSFIRELGVYPTGTYVRLVNGEIGVVTGRGATSTTPIVHSLIGPCGEPLSCPIKRDTATSLASIRDVLQEGNATVRVTMQQLWGDEAAR